MIYFRGCVVRERLPFIQEATEKILKKAEVDYELLDDEPCCGSFLLRTGHIKEALDIMQSNLPRFMDKTILVSCAGCYRTLKYDYPQQSGVQLKVIHTSQLFQQLIDQGKLKLEKKEQQITYHDPCHLGRHSQEYEAPRSVIRQVGNLVEMDKTRDHAHCCGAGGGLRSAYPKAAEYIALSRIKEAEDTGAEILVTTCSFCLLNLLSGEGRIKVKELSQIINQEDDDG